MTQTLYRKYRPNKFSDVVGQETVISALINSLKSGKISHAYIFAGSRGTGKTSVARIFASELGVSVNDLYEIDAASNRGIDDIRAIKDAVNTIPFDSKYKLYIIDEAHMLTREAWNALLKTLEEPPSHVIFILATTEIDKIPDTIMSRCEFYLFRKPDQNVLREIITKTSEKEGYKIEAEASDVLALTADGSFRDAHGALQKIIGSISSKVITLKDVENISGVPRSELINDLINTIQHRNIGAAVSTLIKVRESNIDVKVLTKLLIDRIRQIILIRISNDFDDTCKRELTKENYAFLKSHSEKKGKDTNINSDTLITLLDTLNMVSVSSLPEIALESRLIKIIEG